MKIRLSCPLLLAAGLVLVSVAQAGAEPKTLAVEQIPAPIKAIVAAHVPDAVLSKAKVEIDENADNDYVLSGVSGGRNILIKLEASNLGELHEITILYETNKALRRKSGAEVVGLDEMPIAVMAAARAAVKDFMPETVEQAQIGGRDGYDLTGKAAGFEVKIKLLATGEVLALEKELIGE